MDYQRTTKKIFFLFILFVIAFFYQKDLKDQSLFWDEHAWIQRGSLYYEAYFIDWNFSPKIWQARNSFDQPKLSEMLFGFWTRLWYRQDLGNLFIKTDFNQVYSQRSLSFGRIYSRHYFFF